MLLKSLAVWMGILGFAIVNGLFREQVLIPMLGTTSSMVLSGILLSCLILATAYLALPWLGARSLQHVLTIGLGWLALTVVFEFVFGLLRGMAMEDLLAAYTLKGGNIWPVVLAVTGGAPWIAAKLRGRL